MPDDMNTATDEEISYARQKIESTWVRAFTIHEVANIIARLDAAESALAAERVLNRSVEQILGKALGFDESVFIPQLGCAPSVRVGDEHNAESLAADIALRYVAERAAREKAELSLKSCNLLISDCESYLTPVTGDYGLMMRGKAKLAAEKAQRADTAEARVKELEEQNQRLRDANKRRVDERDAAEARVKELEAGLRTIADKTLACDGDPSPMMARLLLEEQS